MLPTATGAEHFFSAAVDSDTTLTDKIALGLMAGWDVKGPIRDAGFASFYGHQGKNPHSFVDELLFFPSHRALLLDEGARRIALALETDKKAEAAYGMLTTYSLFEPRDESETEVAMLDELDRQRKASGKPPVERVSDTESVVTPVMKKLERGATDPMSGLREVLDAYAKATQQDFQGTLYATTIIDGFRPEFSGPLLELENVAVTVRVGFYVGDGSNWGQYVVYVVFMPMSEAMVNAPTGRGGR